MSQVLVLALAVQAASVSAVPAPLPDYDEMREQIAAADARLFWAFFEGCEPAALDGLLLPDFSMLHDQGGLVASSRAELVSSLVSQCSARAEGGRDEGYRNRRLPVPGTRIVRPLGEWGALEEGAHVFFEWNGEQKAWAMTGGGRYMHTWKWMPIEGTFRLAQSLSYDHGAALPYPPGD